MRECTKLKWKCHGSKGIWDEDVLRWTFTTSYIKSQPPPLSNTKQIKSQNKLSKSDNSNKNTTQKGWNESKDKIKGKGT